MSRVDTLLPPAAVFDWDGTLHRGLTLRSWIRFLSINKAISREKSESMEAMLSREGDKSYPYEDFAQDVVSEYARCIEHIAIEEIKALAQRFVEADSKSLFAFVIPLLALLRESNIATLVVSGCPEEVLDAYAKLLGIDVVIGAKVEAVGGHYTGKVQANPALYLTKEAEMVRLVRHYSIYLALGNTASDIPLLRSARFPVFFMAPVIDIAGASGFTRVSSETELLTVVRSALSKYGLRENS